MNKIVLLGGVLAAGVVLGIYLQQQPKAQKIKTQVQAVAEQAGADVKTGLQRAGGVATNVVGQARAGAQRAVEFTTNAVGEIKQKLN